MSEENKEIFDFQVRSIMETASEEVPAHVWDSLDAKLDVMARNRRKAALFKTLRYTAAALASAAALTFWLIFPKDRDGVQKDFVSREIAVVETPIQPELPMPEKLLAMAPRQHETAIVSEFETKKVIEEINAAESLSHTRTTDVKDSGKTSISKKKTPSLQQGKTPYAMAKQMPDFQPNDKYDTNTGSNRITTSFVIYGDAVGSAAIRKSSNRAYHMMAPPRPIENKLEEVSESAYSIPITFGVGARISFTPRWSITAGVNYTILSRSFKGFWYIKDSDGLVVPESLPVNITNTQSYIGIPVNVYFNIVKAKFLDFYVYAGGTMEKCVENKFKLNDFPRDPRKYGTKGLQWSVNVGLGVEFILTDWLGLYLDPNVRYYFDTNQPKSIRTVQPISFGCELGLRVRL